MSLGIVVKGPEGVVLAADSRLTLLGQMGGTQVPVNFDNATKLLTFTEPNRWVAAVTYGDAVIGTSANDLRTANSYVPEFEATLGENRLSIGEFAQKLSEFYMARWIEKMPTPHPGSGMEFVVAGFNNDAPYGYVYEFVIPHNPTPIEKAPGQFSITVGGQHEYAVRILQGYDPNVLTIAKQQLNLTDMQVTQLQQALAPLAFTVPYNILPLQDCIDLAVFIIKSTISAQKLSLAIRGVGGSIDVAVITPKDGLKIIRQKTLVSETLT